jgi:FMN phosphatase YigB (HAD superfamily)|tara:strand:+ start:311 stop:958 length:648 start_codon:yes stop_codon:yes gene_type:complete
MPTAQSNTSDFDAFLFEQIRANNPSGLILDMDDTLYWESGFVIEFARQMRGKVLLEKGGLQADQFFNFFTENWSRGNRKSIFQLSVLEFNLETVSASDFLESMRSMSVPGGLALRHWARRTLTEMSIPIAILTNGDPVLQKNKFSQLSPEELLRNVDLICAKDYEAKPSAMGALKIIKNWGLAPDEVLLIGDSQVDLDCAKNAGCGFLWSVDFMP